MDVFLLGTSLSLSAYLPRFLFDSKIEQVTMAAALALSLSLFSVTVVEALPASARIFFNNDDWISVMYLYLLWFLSVEVVVVLPALAGAAWAESLGGILCSTKLTAVGDRDGDDNKYTKTTSSWPWWLRFLLSTMYMIVQTVVVCFWRSVCWISSRRRQQRTSVASSSSMKESSSVLVMTVHDQQQQQQQHHQGDMKTSSSSDNIMMKGPPSPTGKRSSVVGLGQTTTSTKSPQPITAKLRCLMLVGSVCGILTVLTVLRSLGPLVVETPVASKDDDETTTTTLALVVSWLCAVGLLLSSLLNGFGSVSLPYTYLVGLFLKPVRPETIKKLTAELQSLQEAVVKKKALLRELTVEGVRSPSSGVTIPILPPVVQHRSSITSSTNSTASGSSALHGSASFLDLGDDVKHRRHILQTELEFLDDIVKETALDIDELKYSQTVAVAARTSFGKLKSLVGIVFSVILLARLSNAGWTIWMTASYFPSRRNSHGRKSGDIVTTALLFLTGHNYVSAKRYALLSQMVSLTLTAVLSFTQVRTFLRTVTIVNRRLTKFYHKCSCSDGNSNNALGSTGNAGGSGNSTNSSPSSLLTNSKSYVVSTHSQLIAGMLGCYSLACIVLIKMMLPVEFSIAFSKALGEQDIFVIHSYVVNLVFFWSAIVSSAILGMLLSIQRQNNLRHAAETPTKGLNDKDKGYALPDV